MRCEQPPPAIPNTASSWRRNQRSTYPFVRQPGGGNELVPEAPKRYAFPRAAAQLADHGLEVRAWMALTHRDDPAASTRDLNVVTAFGDVLDHALCPASAEVQRYVATLVAEVAATDGVDALVVEACGQLGFDHQDAHEKTAGADWSEVDLALLSLCFCSACRRQLDGAGVDPQGLALLVRQSVGRGAPSIQDVLADQSAAVVALRVARAVGLRDQVLAVASEAGVNSVDFHASPDEWSTAPATPAWEQLPGARWALPCWQADDNDLARVRATVDLADAESVAAYATILPPKVLNHAALTADLQALIDAGATELHLYHAGLASAARIAAASAAVAALAPRTAASRRPRREPTERLSLVHDSPKRKLMPISLIHSLHRPLVAILRAPRWDRYPAVAEVLWDSGINAIEVTMTTDGAVEAISRIRETLPSGALVGAGTVRTVSQAERAIDAGAQFLVSQIADPVLTQAAAALDVPFIPGALTPTEIVEAAKLGVELIKVSPVGPVGGVDYIAELVGPMPELRSFPRAECCPKTSPTTLTPVRRSSDSAGISWATRFRPRAIWPPSESAPGKSSPPSTPVGPA